MKQAHIDLLVAELKAIRKELADIKLRINYPYYRYYPPYPHDPIPWYYNHTTCGETTQYTTGQHTLAVSSGNRGNIIKESQPPR